MGRSRWNRRGVTSVGVSLLFLVCSGGEEVTIGPVTELVDEDAEAARRVAEASGRLGRREAVDEEGAEGFVLSMGGAGGLQEPAGQR